MGRREAGQDPTFISEEHRRNVARARDRGHDVPTSFFARLLLEAGSHVAQTSRTCNGGATSASRRFARCNALRFSLRPGVIPALPRGDGITERTFMSDCMHARNSRAR